MKGLIALAIATAVLVSIPGPNVALIVANSLRSGLRSGAITVLGTTLGVAMQLMLVVVGMATVIEIAADVLTWIKWAGVAYLVWLGALTWRQPAKDLAAIEAQPAVFWQSCAIAAVNPKTLLFNAAFLPQFVSADAASGHLLLVAGVFLAVLLMGDMLWALFAGSARPLLSRFSRAHNRISGGFFVAAGAGLALSRRSL